MRLFQSHRILHVDGMKILVMGLLTEDIMSKAKSDMLLGTFVDLSDAAREVGSPNIPLILRRLSFG